MKREKWAKMRAKKIEEKRGVPRYLALQWAGREASGERSSVGMRRATDQELSRAARYGKASATNESLDHRDAIKDFRSREEDITQKAT